MQWVHFRSATISVPPRYALCSTAFISPHLPIILFYPQSENDSVDELEARIIGSKGCPFAGGVFKLKITVQPISRPMSCIHLRCCKEINQIIPIFIHNRFFLTYSFYPTFSTDACKKNGAVTRATTKSGVLNVYQTSMQPLCAPLTSQKLCTFFFFPFITYYLYMHTDPKAISV